MGITKDPSCPVLRHFFSPVNGRLPIIPSNRSLRNTVGIRNTGEKLHSWNFTMLCLSNVNNPSMWPSFYVTRVLYRSKLNNFIVDNSKLLDTPRRKRVPFTTTPTASNYSLLIQLIRTCATRQKCRDYVRGLIDGSIRGELCSSKRGLAFPEKPFLLPLFTFLANDTCSTQTLLLNPPSTLKTNPPPDGQFPFSFSFDFGGGDERGELWRVW